MTSLKDVLKRPSLIVPILGQRGHLKWMDDETYLKFCFKGYMGYTLDIDNPKTYNEKLQWLKLHDRNPLYTTLVDKVAVKKWVADKIGPEYVTETYGVWESADDIDINRLPEKFVLKTNHDSGGVAVCSNKSSFDFEAAKKKLNRRLKNNYYYHGREWPYKNVKPRVFAEEYLEEADSEDLPDYKFFCFDGVAKAMFIATDRMALDKETKFDFYDMDFNHLPFTNGHPNSTCQIDKPVYFEEMKRLAECLSKGIPHVRVDFYIANNQVYFGEMTFSHWSGYVPFVPESWDRQFGDWIELPSGDGSL
jgi:hypothetical protein